MKNIAFNRTTEDLCSIGMATFTTRYTGGLFNIIGDDLVAIDQAMIDAQHRALFAKRPVDAIEG